MNKAKDKMVTLNQLDLFKKEQLKDAVERFAEKIVVETLRRIIRTDDVEGMIHAICDAESNVVSYIDTSGRVHFCVGATAEGTFTAEGDLTVGGRMLMEHCKVAQSTESGIFYILDNDNHILFEINSKGKVNFNGIPDDIQSALDALESRIDALEGE